MSYGTDDGYYAIKGFLYQFDRALIEVLKNPTAAAKIRDRYTYGRKKSIPTRNARTRSPASLNRPAE